ncbi:hypothetical protein OKW34_003191 [Paraburkholderia youngii]|uniref:hypothetical protein n=1 Tax=Paraburkholderia TaxID=1822464 RepID=UPI003D1C5BB6
MNKVLTRVQLTAEIVLRALTVPLLGLFVAATIHQYVRDPSRITLLVFAFAEVLTVVLAVFARVPSKRASSWFLNGWRQSYRSPGFWCRSMQSGR